MGALLYTLCKICLYDWINLFCRPSFSKLGLGSLLRKSTMRVDLSIPQLL